MPTQPDTTPASETLEMILAACYRIARARARLLRENHEQAQVDNQDPVNDNELQCIDTINRNAEQSR